MIGAWAVWTLRAQLHEQIPNEFPYICTDEMNARILEPGVVYWLASGRGPMLFGPRGLYTLGICKSRLALTPAIMDHLVLNNKSALTAEDIKQSRDNNHGTIKIGVSGRAFCPH